jgi:uncharacterized protein (DUF3820 family)
VVYTGSMEPVPLSDEVLLDLASVKMPFGRFRGRVLCDLPEPYLVWFKQNGFPQGKLGRLLEALYEIKLNGLEYLLKPVKKFRA